MTPDPYRYFRLEARELQDQLAQSALDLERGGDIAAALQRLLRLAHTLKGAARVVKAQEIADRAHAIEDTLEPHRSATGDLPRAAIDALLAHIDAIGAALKLLTPAAPAQPQAAAQKPAEETRMVRANAAEMDAVLDGLSEAHALLGGLRQAAQSAEQSQHLAELLALQLAPQAADQTLAMAEDLRRRLTGIERGLASGIDQMDRELRQLRDAVEQLRLTSAGTMFIVLERTARDAAQALGKQVVFSAAGADIRLEFNVLDTIQRALVQIIRNAVAHGIEAVAERRRRGKPDAGAVTLKVGRRGQRILFECRDDGAGIDLDAVRRKAAERGLVTADADLVDLLLHGGISTSASVTEVAGRGVGLDVVRDVTDRLGGDVAIRTEAGKGTVFELTVPPSLAAIEALVVEVAGTSAGIPLDAVPATLRLGHGDIAWTASGGSVIHDGKVIPFVPLATLLGAARAQTQRNWNAVVVNGGQGFAAIGVDRLHGTARLVMRPLPAYAPSDPIVAGASLDAEGNPQLILDADRIVAAARGARPQESETAGGQRHPILVIDDSLTTRMLEQSILESAGYAVALAVSAEEGLELARQNPYALFLVDVEMPGMDGFAFVTQIRADPALHGIPAVLISSRDTPEDFRRGTEAGAQGYIVKGAFDQTQFLAKIKTLLD